MPFGIGGNLYQGACGSVPWPDGHWLVYNGGLGDMIDVGDGTILFVE